jgi:hypothetical protein
MPNISSVEKMEAEIDRTSCVQEGREKYIQPENE